eukprot:RCo044967
MSGRAMPKGEVGCVGDDVPHNAPSLSSACCGAVLLGSFLRRSFVCMSNSWLVCAVVAPSFFSCTAFADKVFLGNRGHPLERVMRSGATLFLLRTAALRF